jgi:hypothetical protein
MPNSNCTANFDRRHHVLKFEDGSQKLASKLVVFSPELKFNLHVTRDSRVTSANLVGVIYVKNVKNPGWWFEAKLRLL